MGCHGHRSPLVAAIRAEKDRISQLCVPLSSLYCFHVSKSECLVAAWLLTVNWLRAFQFVITAHISKLVRQLFFMGPWSLQCLGVP